MKEFLDQNQDVTTSIIIEKRFPSKVTGKYPVKLRVTYNRKSKYYAIKGEHLSEEEFLAAYSGKARGDNKKRRLIYDAIEARARKIIDTVLDDFSFEMFQKEFVGYKTRENTIQSYIKDKVGELEADGKYKSANLYETTLKTLSKFDKSISFEKITPEYLRKFEQWMIEQGKSITTVGIYLRNLRAIFNKALNDRVIKNYPFSKGVSDSKKYRIPTAKNIKKALTKAEIQKIYNYDPVNEGEKKAKGYWLFSYFCNGMNMADIVNLKYKNFNENGFTFIRQKTKDTTKNSNQINVYLLPPALKIIEELGNENRNPETFVFPVYNEAMTDKQKYYKLHRHTKYINKYMNQIAEKCGIEQKVNTYHARHSYSTISKRSGASIEFISEQLGHQSTSITRNYLDSFEDETREKFAKALMDFNEK